MNTLLFNSVTLNQVILKNAKKQFSVESPRAFITLAHSSKNMSVGSIQAAASPLTANLLTANVLTAKVNTQLVSGETQYDIATSGDGSRWSMTLTFTVNNAVNEIPYVVLSFSQFGQAQEMVFEQVNKTQTANQYKAKLVINQLSQRDAILRALSDYDAQTTLVVVIKTDSSILNTVTDPQIFYFAPDYYPYIYKGLAPPKPRLELIQTPLEYESVWNNYYQDNINKSYLYYLPDSFELASDMSGKPMLSLYFTVPKNSDSLDNVEVTFEYFLLPKVNRKRIVSATEQFTKKQPDGKLIPFSNAEKFEMFLSLPAGKTKEENAIINLQSGIVDSFTIPSSQFAKVWDAFFNQSLQNILLKGNLKVFLKGFNPNSIPVRLSLLSEYQDNPSKFILQSTVTTIDKTVTFISDASSYSQDVDKPIKRILVDAGLTTVVLDKNNLSEKVKFKVSVLQLILNPKQNITYDYNLQIFYEDGDVLKLMDQTSTFEIIYVP